MADMTIREEFEKRFPVPEFDCWFDEYSDRYHASSGRDDLEMAIYNKEFAAFQAGWEAAKQQGEVK